MFSVGTREPSPTRPISTPDGQTIWRRIFRHRLWRSEQGDQLERMAQSDGHASGVVKAVCWLKENFDKPFSVKLIAQEANMSPSGLHHHLKTLTNMPPPISKAPSLAGGSIAHADRRDE